MVNKTGNLCVVGHINTKKVNYRNCTHAGPYNLWSLTMVDHTEVANFGTAEQLETLHTFVLDSANVSCDGTPKKLFFSCKKED